MTDNVEVLIVDDNEIVRRKIKRILSKSNYKILEAESGEEALNLIRENVFDVIFLDIRLSLGDNGLDVFEKAKQIRESDLGKVIILTGSMEDNVEDRAKELGAFEFLEKDPFDGKLISETFYEALNMTHK